MDLVCIGCGKMGSALVEGVVRSGAVAPANLWLVDAHAESAAGLAARTGGRVADDVVDTIGPDRMILVCVKPPDVEPLLHRLAPQLDRFRPLVVSIAAGVTLERLQYAAGDGVPVVRVMPNTPALVGRGVSAYSPAEDVDEAALGRVEAVLGAVGLVERVPEALMDAVTGTSGSGPAYVYTIIEALADGGCLMGLTKPQALRLAAQTVAGAAEMVLQTGLHPAQLRDQVTSPGGTTIAGLAALELAGLRGALISAVQAAAERSADMAREAEEAAEEAGYEAGDEADYDPEE